MRATKGRKTQLGSKKAQGKRGASRFESESGKKTKNEEKVS